MKFAIEKDRREDGYALAGFQTDEFRQVIRPCSHENLAELRRVLDETLGAHANYIPPAVRAELEWMRGRISHRRDSAGDACHDVLARLRRLLDTTP